jgi:hypothetical protein
VTGAESQSDRQSQDADEGRATLGVVAAPGPAARLVRELAPRFDDLISSRLPGYRWQVQLVTDRLVSPPTDLTELIDATRRRLLHEGWEVAVCVTDLPLATRRRPVVAHASMTHAVAVLSLPALGTVNVLQRAADAIVRLTAVLLGDAQGESTDAHDIASRRRRLALHHRLRELRTHGQPEDQGVGVVAGAVSGNLRLLLGMLRANRPWRLATQLSKALIAALAVAVIALVTTDIWLLADRLGPVRLSLLTMGSVIAVILTLIVGAGLWESAPSPSTPPAARAQVTLFNIVTLLTVALGVFALYAALLALTAAGAILLVTSQLMAKTLGHPVGLIDLVTLAWLASSLATIAGALGAGLENDETVREAAYKYQPDDDLPERPR